jgi:peptide/nickel transport system substrate-binding protein
MKGLACKQLYVTMAVLLFCMFLIAGCGGSPGAITTTAATSSPAATKVSPKYGGKVTRGNVGSPLNLGNPAKRNAASDMGIISPCVETLMGVAYGNYTPRLAESWDIAADGKAITFHIRKGVKFHDGTDLNAAAVKVNYDLVRTSKELTSLNSVASIDVVDEYTVRLNLKQFDWSLMSYLATNTAGKIYSPKALTENTPEQLLFNPVGTGPFKFVSYQKDTLIKYVRFDDYWQKGKPYLDSVDFKIFADATTAIMAMKAGEVDVMNVSAEDMLGLKKSGFKIQGSIGYNATLSPDGANADSPFADVRVRKAVSYAIDRKMLADSLGYGYYYPTYQLYGDWSALAYNPNIVGQPYDPAKAKQLLAEAGYPNGFKTTIFTGSATDMQLAIQDMLSKVGIQAEIQEVTTAKSSELSAGGWRNGMMCGNNPLGSGHQDPSQNMTNGYMSRTGSVSVYKPADLMTLFDQSKTEMDPVKRKAIFQDIMKKIVDDYCIVIQLYLTTDFTAVNPDFFYPEKDSYQGVMGKMEDVWRYK